jgi:hypothetical protein
MFSRRYNNATRTTHPAMKPYPIFRSTLLAASLATLLAGCAQQKPVNPAIATVQLATLNDFHGHLEPSKATATLSPARSPTKMPAAANAPSRRAAWPR